MIASLAAAPADQTLRIVVSSATDVGGRQQNEDAIHVGPLPALGDDGPVAEHGYMLAVADGMGGYQKGEIASAMALAEVAALFEEDPGGDTALLLKQAFRRANERIYVNGQGATPPAMMGTTLIVVATRGKYATIASIGDSRVYLARANRLTQITKDHSLVADQVAQGDITESEARESPHRNILTHALGHRPKLDAKMPNVFEITLLAEDRVLLCSDGFYDVVPDEDLLSTLVSSDPDAVAQRLVSIAVERGTSDNVSAIVLTILPARDPEPVLTPAVSASSFLPLIAAVVVALLLIAVVLFLALS